MFLFALTAQLRRRLRVSAASGDGRVASPGGWAATELRRGGSLKATCAEKYTKRKESKNSAVKHSTRQGLEGKHNSPSIPPPDHLTEKS